jgi:uncharacterized membrane protein
VRAIIAVDRAIYRIASHWLLWVNALFMTHVASLFLAPALRARGHDSFARPIYAVNGLFCHQKDERSFKLFGEKMACCERCAAIYGSILIVGLLFVVLRDRVRKPFAYEVGLLALPAIVDGGGQAAGLWESSAGSRVLSGAFLGVAICWFALPYFESGFGRIRSRLETLFARLVSEGRARPL